MQIQLNPLSCNGMTRNGNDLIVEASDIGYHGCQPLYDDACDVGVALLSPKTGNIVRRYHIDTIMVSIEMWLSGYSNLAQRVCVSCLTCRT